MNEELYNEAQKKIKKDSKCKPTCISCIGPPGPMGPAGPATIEIGTTSTGLPGTDASVTNVGTNENVILNFVIPEGEIGPEGPPGTTSLSSALIDNDGIQTVATNSLVDLGTIINVTGTELTFTAPNTVTLTEGTYYISYEALIANSTNPGDVGASILVNNVIAANASEYVPATFTQTQINLQHSITITTPTTIQINNGSSVSNIFHDSSLFILKIA